jgi:hypothetical protein
MRIERRMVLVVPMGVAARRVRLPDLDERPGERTARRVDDTPRDDDALSLGLRGRLAREIGVPIGEESGIEQRPRELVGIGRLNDRRPFRGSKARAAVVGIVIRRIGPVHDGSIRPPRQAALARVRGTHVRIALSESIP